MQPHQNPVGKKMMFTQFFFILVLFFMYSIHDLQLFQSLCKFSILSSTIWDCQYKPARNKRKREVAGKCICLLIVLIYLFPYSKSCASPSKPGGKKSAFYMAFFPLAIHLFRLLYILFIIFNFFYYFAASFTKM